MVLVREKRADNKSAVENVFLCFLLGTEVVVFPPHTHTTVREWLNELIGRLMAL